MSVEALLAQAHVLTDKYDALAAATGESFNLFAVLGRETDEVHTHSAILAELLNPNGSHGQGPVFARHFVARLLLGNVAIDQARVRKEFTVGPESRADIVIEAGDTCIVIENKIHALDQVGQLERYHAYAAQWAHAKVFYLTLHGDRPSNDSLGELPPDRVTCISYASDVLPWLDDCIKEVARVPHIREILAHYQGLLRKLTGQSTGELTMDLARLLANKQGNRYNFELVPHIAEAMTTLSIEKEWAFWEMVKVQILEPEDHRWSLSPAPNIGDASNPLKEVSKDVLRHAHIGRQNRWFYGWTFRIDSRTDWSRHSIGGTEVLLRVECDDGGWGRYGLIAVTLSGTTTYRLARTEDTTSLFDEWAKRMSSLEEGWRTDDEWWLAWTYPAEDVDLRKTDPWLRREVIRALMDDEFLVAPFIRDIRASIDRIVRLESTPG